MSQKFTLKRKENIRNKIARVESERDAAIKAESKMRYKLLAAQAATKTSRDENRRLRDRLRWLVGTQTRRFFTV